MVYTFFWPRCSFQALNVSGCDRFLMHKISSMSTHDFQCLMEPEFSHTPGSAKVRLSVFKSQFPTKYHIAPNFSIWPFSACFVFVQFCITVSQPLLVYRLLGRGDDVPCWWILFQRSTEMALYELIILRVVRFWLKLNLSSLHLQHYRSHRFRIAENRTTARDRSPSSSSFSKSLRWARFSNTRNLSKILVVVYLICLTVLLFMRYVIEDTCDSIMENFTAAGAGASVLRIEIICTCLSLLIRQQRQSHASSFSLSLT